MPDPASWLVVEPGWKVVSADGDELGRVDEVVGDETNDIFNGLVVVTGLLGSPKYVPSEQVGEIRDGEVRLALSTADAERLEDWEPPA